MFRQFIKKCLIGLNSQLDRIHRYFTDGSFVIAFYPFLMHPCVKKGYHSLIKMLAFLSVFLGVFYIFGELVTSLFSQASLASYFSYRTLELLQPIGRIIDGRESNLSPLAFVMMQIFIVQSYFFLLFYLFGMSAITQKKYWLIGIILALFFSIGLFLTASTESGKYTEGGLNNLGFSITFLLGNLILLMTAFDIRLPSLKSFKYWSIQLGLVGLACIATTFFIQNNFTPIIERVGIYSIMIWEILAGFALIKITQK